jgi:hypothetical protein
VRLWGLPDLTPRGDWPSGGDAVPDLAASPDGRWLAACAGGRGLVVWDAATGRPGHEYPADGVSPVLVAFAPDGQSVAAARPFAGGTVHELAGPGRSRPLPELPIRCLALAPDGGALATGGEYGFVRVWDRETRAESLVLAAHRGPVRAVAYSPDGRRLATGGEDGTVRVWDARTGDDLLTLAERSGPVTCLAFSPDGHTLASAATGGARPAEIRLRRGRPAAALTQNAP